MKISTFSKAVSNSPTGTTTIQEFVENVKNGTWKSQVETLRSLTEKEEIDSYKRSFLPAVSLSCVFDGTRSKENARNHTGVMQVDIDKVQDINHALNVLKNDPHVLFCFVSPSGKGVKAGIRVKQCFESHKDSFVQFKEHIKLEGFDDAVKDVSRVCFVSCDPELYYNPNAEEFEIVTKVKVPSKNIVPITWSLPSASMKTAQKTLDTAIKMLCSMSSGYKHADRLKAGMLIGGGIAAGYFSEHEAISSIEPFVIQSTSRPQYAMKCITDAIEAGKTKPLEPSKGEMNVKRANAVISKMYEDRTGKAVEEDEGYQTIESVFFIPLGKDGNKHVVYSSKFGVPVSFGTIKKDDLLYLATLDLWEAGYSEDGEKVNWDLACSDIMSRCDEKGFYNSSRVRGRGVWVENGSVVINTGKNLYIDGVKTKHELHKSEFIYQKGYTLNIGTSEDSATLTESKSFLEIFNNLPIDTETNKHLFAGWLFISIVSGALPWRPHIWLNAPKGSGKTWIFDNVVNKYLGNCAIYANGEETTEAGLRQAIGSDAITVIHEEAEGKSEKGKRNLSAKLMLARQSSSETQATVIKGTIGGKSTNFTMRSSFMFISTKIPDLDSADSSRITQIGLVPTKYRSNAKQHFESLKECVDRVCVDGFFERMRTRAVSMIPVILSTTKTIDKVLFSKVGNQRLVDQLSPMLSGAYCLEHDTAPDETYAEMWISKFNFSHSDVSEEEEKMCIETILSTGIREFNGMTVSELIMNQFRPNSKNQQLNRIGIGLSRECDYVYFDCKNPMLKELLKNTTYHDTYTEELSRLEGSVKKPVTIYGKTKRCVCVPISMVFDEIPEFVEEVEMF